MPEDIKKEEIRKTFVCPICSKEYSGTLQVTYEDGKPTCKHDVKIAEKSLEDKRKENLAASLHAMKMAGEFSNTIPEIKMIEVTSYQENSMGKTEMVPESVVKSLERKAKTVEELQ